MMTPEALALAWHLDGRSVTYFVNHRSTEYLVALPDGSEFIITEWEDGTTDVTPRTWSVIAEELELARLGAR